MFIYSIYRSHEQAYIPIYCMYCSHSRTFAYAVNICIDLIGCLRCARCCNGGQHIMVGGYRRDPGENPSQSADGWQTFPRAVGEEASMILT